MTECEAPSAATECCLPRKALIFVHMSPKNYLKDSLLNPQIAQSFASPEENTVGRSAISTSPFGQNTKIGLHTTAILF